MSKIAALAAALLVATSAANAATIVNLSASNATPNAGLNSGGYSFNPVVETLGAGSYSVGVVGTAGGGLYDAYSVYAPTSNNLAFSDGNWSVTPVGGTTQTQASNTRFNTAAGALSYYGGLSPFTFTLAGTTNVAFYLDDTAYPYFADDNGGVSLAINSVPVPEPASIALLGMAFAALGLLRFRSKQNAGMA